MSSRGAWLLALSLAVAAGAAACGSGNNTHASGSGGSPAGGSAGAAGSGGGSAGTAGGGSGGVAGSGATAGSGGSAGSGATAGSAGASGSAGVAGSAGADAGADASAGAGGQGGQDAGTAGAGGAGGADGGAVDGGFSFQPYPKVPYPPENPPTARKATLGKILFWDEQMGSDNTMACGTCHRAGAGGSDPRADQPTAHNPGPDGVLGTPDDIHGAQGIHRCQIVSGKVDYIDDPVFGYGPQVTRRKPPSYLDAMFFTDVFWDGRATSKFTVPITGEVAIQKGGALESQSVGPPVANGEMACDNRTWDDILAKLKTVQPLALAHDLPNDIKQMLAKYPTYPDLFNYVYGTPDITTKRVAFAIATHERRLTSNQTPFDKFIAGDKSALTAAQQHGLDLFMTKARCNLCHKPPLFTDDKFHNLGFMAIWDTGREEVTSDPADKGKFLTPTLRNVGLRETGGLLHTGSGVGASLEQVMHAYNNAPQGENVDPLMQPLNLTQAEIDDIIDFMRNGLTDPRVANETYPFDRPKLSTEP